MRGRLRTIMEAFFWAGREVRDNPGGFAITSAIVAAALFIASLSLLAYRNAKIVAGTGAAPQLIVYLEPGLAVGRVERIQTALRSIPAVAEVAFLSEEDASRRLAAFFGADAAELERGLLPASLEVTLVASVADVVELHPLTARLASVEGVLEVEYLGEWSDQLNHLVENLRHLLIVLSVLFGAAALVIVCFAQRLACARSSADARVLQLVGASSMPLWLPAILRGALQGLVGATAALVLAYVVYTRLADPISELLISGAGRVALDFLPCGDILLLTGGGALLGAIGGVWAARSRSL